MHFDKEGLQMMNDGRLDQPRRRDRHRRWWNGCGGWRRYALTASLTLVYGCGGDDSDGGGSGSGGSSTPDEAPYENAGCIAEDGPTAAVTGSGTGAFADADDWTNWSVDSSGE